MKWTHPLDTSWTELVSSVQFSLVIQLHHGLITEMTEPNNMLDDIP
jgi:hypothetical protein